MENHFNCIYCYTNKVNGKKYVGQAVDFNTRHRKHIWGAYNEKTKNERQRRDYNTPFHKAIRKYGIENFEIEILKENLLNQEELNYWECYYIKEFDTLIKNQKGYNVANGGNNGNPLAGKTDEELAEIRRKWYETMNNKTDEEKKEFSRRISEIMKGKGKGEKNKGEKHGRATLVDRFDKWGNYVDTKYQFEYVQLGFDSGNISSCCKGRLKTHKGFIFKYHNK